MKEEQIAAGGVVIREDSGVLRVLLIEDSYGHWTWPKGHAEHGDPPAETAAREIAEETGQKELEILEELGKQEYDFTWGEKSIHKKVHIFLVRALGTDRLTPQTSEILRAEWFSPEAAAATIEYTGSKELLMKGIDAYIRRHSAGGGR